MILDFNPYTSNSVAFSVQNIDGTTRELGVAFINIPWQVWPAAAIVYGDPEGKLSMDYMAGPQGWYLFPRVDPEFLERKKDHNAPGECFIVGKHRSQGSVGLRKKYLPAHRDTGNSMVWERCPDAYICVPLNLTLISISKCLIKSSQRLVVKLKE